MKKAIAVLLVTVLLTGCCSHSWEDATCLLPRHCSRCQKTEGSAAEHRWLPADLGLQCETCGEVLVSPSETVSTGSSGCGDESHQLALSRFDMETITYTCTLCSAERVQPMYPEFPVQWMTGLWAESMDLRPDGTVVYTGWDETFQGTWVCHGLVNSDWGGPMLTATIYLMDLEMDAFLEGSLPGHISIRDPELIFQFMGERTPD